MFVMPAFEKRKDSTKFDFKYHNNISKQIILSQCHICIESLYLKNSFSFMNCIAYNKNFPQISKLVLNIARERKFDKKIILIHT